jgi:thioredoxin reductase
MHGFLTRDGIPPLEFLRLAREELVQYTTVKLLDATVTDARCRPNSRFETTLESGEVFESRKLLIATGVRDNIPDIDGIRDLYGRSIFHCPYCDGWEVRDQPLAVYGRGERGYGLSLELTAWSRDILLCTDGPCELERSKVERLARNGIEIREQRVLRVEGADGILERIVFAEGSPVQRRALFFTTGQHQQSPLAIRLGCEFNDKGTVRTGKYETTHLPGLFVAGDASRAVQWVIVAASEGAEAAFAINTDLIREDLL